MDLRSKQQQQAAAAAAVALTLSNVGNGSCGGGGSASSGGSAATSPPGLGILSSGLDFNSPTVTAASLLAAAQQYQNSGCASLNSSSGSSTGQAQEDRSKTNLIINYLPQTFDSEQLRELFEQLGPVRTHKVIRDKQTGASLCYGFVDFVFPEHAERAIREFHGMRIGNKKLRVAFAAAVGGGLVGFGSVGAGAPSIGASRSMSSMSSQGVCSGPGNLYIAGIPKNWSDSDLGLCFSSFGKISQVKLLTEPLTSESKGVGFVVFDERSAAERAITSMHGMQRPEWTTPLLVKFAEDGQPRRFQQGSGVRGTTSAAAAAASNMLQFTSKY